MIGYFKNIWVGFYSLLAGMAVTIRYFVRPIVTVQYPREKLKMSPRYRGHIELIIDPETKTHRCIACEMCARICPSQLITVEGIKVGKKKLPTKHYIQFQYCSLCGLCIESCPTDALKWSDEYRMAGFSRESCEVDLLARLQQQQRLLGYPPTPIPEPVPEEAAAEAEKAATEEKPEAKAKAPAKKAAKKEEPATEAPKEKTEKEKAPPAEEPEEEAPKEEAPATEVKDE
ncbi:MAG: NADH-quinone oxidoreductase subunit I [Deltaproteobacteria bacterium]|nr:NADH-quinone oxidoreductase subunit I [Deltaproteobacteria bacterium]